MLFRSLASGGHTIEFISQQQTPVVQRSCAITVAAWKYYANVRTLYDSIQSNSPSIRCFVWFVADTAYHSDTDESLATATLIKDKIANLFDVVTLDEMTSKMSDFAFFTRLSFGSKLGEDQCSSLITPFALKYTLQHHHADSVIYVDKWKIGRAHV